MDRPVLSISLALATVAAITACLWGAWSLSQAVSRGRAFPTIPHAEPVR